MRHNIADVARKARVNPSTVSRILRGAEGYSFSEKTRKKVLAAVDELDYSPHPGATLFRMKKTNLVGVAVQPDSSYAGFQLLPKLFARISAGGFTPVMLGYKEENVADGYSLFGDVNLLCGVVCTYQNLEEKTVAICERQKRSIPIVTMARSITNSPMVRSVRSNSEKGVAQAVNFLHQLGHRRIAYVCRSTDAEGVRVKSYEESMNRHQQTSDLITLESFNADNFKIGEHAGSEIARNSARTAVLCSNDEIALGLIHGLTQTGLDVPRDVSVIGFDDLPFAEFAHGGLTTLRNDFGKKAETAVELLISRIENGDPPNGAVPSETLIDCELIVRNTTAPPKRSER